MSTLTDANLFSVQTTLSYSCICSNNSSPGLQYYENTMATYICQESYRQCIVNHPDDAAGQELCKTDIQDNCGTLDASKVSAPASSSSAAASSTSAAASSTSATAASASASATGAAIRMGSEYGLGVAAAAGAAAFGLLL